MQQACQLASRLSVDAGGLSASNLPVEAAALSAGHLLVDTTGL